MRPLIPFTFAVAGCAFLTTACGAATTAASSASAPASSATSAAGSAASSAASATAATSASASTSTSSSSVASSTASASSSANASVAGLPALVQKYCTKTQKVCFSYPAGYKVVSADTAAGGNPGEQGHVEDPQGNPVFFFADGIGGIGGGCDATGMKDQTIVTSLPTKIAGLPVSSEYDAPDVHIVQAVIQPASGGGYLAQEYMSRSKNFASAGTVHTCGEAFSDVIAVPGNKGAVHVGVYQFADWQHVKRYTTAEEAKQALASPAYLVAAAMMQTVTIG